MMCAPTCSMSPALQFGSSVLVIDDDPFSQRLFSNLLTSILGTPLIHVAGTYREGLKALVSELPPDLLIVDLFLDGTHRGSDLLLEAMKVITLPCTLIVSAISQREFARDFPPYLAQIPFLPKPLSLSILEAQLNQLRFNPL